jgi:hypothetical protein
LDLEGESIEGLSGTINLADILQDQQAHGRLLAKRKPRMPKGTAADNRMSTHKAEMRDGLPLAINVKSRMGRVSRPGG